VVLRRLRPGDEVRAELDRLVREEGIRGGVLLSLVGSVTDPHLRNRAVVEYPGKYEIAAATGTLTPDGVHVHVVVSDEGGRVVGGHLSRAAVFTTVEVAVLDTGIALRREFDPGTGYSELVVPDEGSPR